MRAMVFAAGIGSRLGDITKHRPKCLVEVEGVTMLERVLTRLRLAGVTSVMINLFHLPEMIEDFFRARGTFGLDVHFSREEVLLGTGGGLKRARDFFSGSELFLVHNSDIFTDLDLSTLVDAHRSGDVGTLAVMDRPTSRYLLFDESGSLCGWENPGSKSALIDEATPAFRRAFSGIQVLHPRVFDFMEDLSGDFSIISAYMNSARGGQAVRGFDMTASYWMDMGKPENLEALRSHLRSA